jgi:hypothetical protein
MRSAGQQSQTTDVEARQPHKSPWSGERARQVSGERARQVSGKVCDVEVGHRRGHNNDE